MEEGTRWYLVLAGQIAYSKCPTLDSAREAVSTQCHTGLAVQSGTLSTLYLKF